MPDLNDFYAFKMTSSGSGSGGGKNNNSGGGTGCSTALIVLAVIGWVLWLIGKQSFEYYIDKIFGHLRRSYFFALATFFTTLIVCRLIVCREVQ